MQISIIAYDHLQLSCSVLESRYTESYRKELVHDKKNLKSTLFQVYSRFHEKLKCMKLGKFFAVQVSYKKSLASTNQC